MRLIFMATSSFAVPALEKLSKDTKHEILAVITTPDTKEGRGLKIKFSPIKQKALDLNLPILQPEKLTSLDIIQKISDLKSDLGIVISFGKILRKSILTLPRLGCVNIHGSLLPKYRGAAPIQWAVINGEIKTGVTSIFMDEGIDTGDIILKKETEISLTDTSETMFEKLSILGSELLIDTINLIEIEKNPRIAQDNNLANYARIITKEDGKIDWNKSAKEIINLIRGLTPWPGTYSHINNKMLKIWNAVLFENLNISGDKSIIGGNLCHCERSEAISMVLLRDKTPHNGKFPNNRGLTAPGEIISIEKNQGIVVGTGDGTLLIKEVQPENKKRMSAYDFVLGHNIKVGMKFDDNSK